MAIATRVALHVGPPFDFDRTKAERNEGTRLLFRGYAFNAREPQWCRVIVLVNIPVVFVKT